MASKLTSVFDTSDRYLIRLRKMCEAGSAKGLHKLLKWLNPKWMPSTYFKDYLKTEKKVSMRKLNSALKPHQRDALKKDRQGDTYDISLLYILLLWGNEGLADKDDEVWHKKSGCLEYLITAVKNVRNDLMHCYNPIDATEFLRRTVTLRCLLKDMIINASNLCKHICQKEVDLTLHELDSLIDKICDDPLDPKDFTDYKNQLLFSQHCDFVKDKGATALRNRHGKYSSLTPASLLAKVTFPVDDVFTDMIVRGGTEQKEKLKLENLLEVQAQSSADDLILVEGDAGIGKTTLTKKLLSDWTKRKSKIKHIEEYDLMLHAECREHIDSFKILLDSSMSEVSKGLKGEDMVFITLCLRSLIIIDGLDELNKKSTLLFQEILKLKKDYDITVLVTSRPEAVEKFFQYARTYQIDTKHILLLGIPVEKREYFVRKYFDGMEKTGLHAQSIEGLLKYLKRTEHRLGYLWRSPYNLSILTILWAMEPDVVNSITTAPELHWEIHQLSLSKLKDRLVNNEATQHMSSSLLNRKVDNFIWVLCRESLLALANDEITLPQEAYQRLEDTCYELDLPVEEMVGAFLKRIFAHSGVRYSFPHKGLQDFLAAYFIWLRLTAKLLSFDAQKVIKDVSGALSKNTVPLHICQYILKLTEAKLVKEISKDTAAKPQPPNDQMITEGVDHFLSQNFVPPDIRQNITKFILSELKKENSDHAISNPKTIASDNVDKIIDCVMQMDDIPKDLCQTVSQLIDDKFKRKLKGDLPISSRTLTMGKTITSIIIEETSNHGLLPETSKFQNMFIALIGIFFIDKTCTISNETKQEALNLLEKTGVKDKDAWLNILNSVRCDEYVANFISQQPHILEGEVLITDSTLFAYISLMKTLKVSAYTTSFMLLDLEVKGDLTGADDLLNMINLHQFKIRSILMNDNNFGDYTVLLKALTTAMYDSDEVNIDIQVNGDLLKVSDLMFQIKRNNFVVRKLEVLDGQIDDCNLSDYISVLNTCPTILSNANNVGIDILIQDELTGGNELLQLINANQFKVKSILVTKKNIMKYAELLRTLTLPLRDPHKVNFDIHFDGNTSIIKLMDEIRRGNFTIRTLDMKGFKINDSDVHQCLLMLKSLPLLTEISNQTVTDINIEGDMVGNEELLELLSIHHFQIKKIMITSNNFMPYTSMLKNLQTPLRDVHQVQIEIDADECLENLQHLIGEIKKKRIVIRMLNVKKIEINNSNFNQWIPVFESLPPLSKECNKTIVDIDIEGSLTGAEELLQLIGTFHFKLKRILITHFNYGNYIQMLKTLKTSIDFPNEVIVDIHEASKNLLSVCEMMHEIKKKNFIVRKLQVKKSVINDENINEYLSMLKVLPKVSKDGNQRGIDIEIVGPLYNADELLQLIYTQHIKVKRLLVTDYNIEEYTAQLKALVQPLGSVHQTSIDINIKGDITGMQKFLEQVEMHEFLVKKISIYDNNYTQYAVVLKGLEKPLKDASEVNIEMCLKVELPQIIDLMELIKEKKFKISLLQLSPFVINDDNMQEYSIALRSLPTIKPLAFKGKGIYICVQRENSKITNVLKEIIRNSLPFELHIPEDLKNPVSQVSFKEAINNVDLSRCNMIKYTGSVVEGMILPKTLQRLDVGLADSGGYEALNRFLTGINHRLVHLNVCLSHHFPVSNDLQPLATWAVQKRTSIFITDIEEGSISNVATLLLGLNGGATNRTRYFQAIAFPRAKLSPKEIKEFLLALEMRPKYALFPSQCKPISHLEQEELERTVNRSKNYALHWGNISEGLMDIDVW